MSLIDPSIDERGFAPSSSSLAVRTIGACYGACHRPDNRLLTGIGVLTVTPQQDGYHFTTSARCLDDDTGVEDLLDWLEPYMAQSDAVISWENWGSVPRRLVALADPARHPGIVSAATDTGGRWRHLLKGHTWHVRQARAAHLPCLCDPAARLDECDRAMPAVLLPDPITTAAELIEEAIAGWYCWVRPIGNFDDPGHPAQAARRALDTWRAERRRAG